MPKEESDEMRNYYKSPKMKEFLDDVPNPHFDDHHIKVPFRMCVVAASGGGKSSFILNLIEKMKNTFYHIYVVHKTDEPIYSYLEKQLPKRVTFYKRIGELPLVNNFPNKGKPQLVVFDDMVTEPAASQQLIAEFYIRGRKRLLSMAYLSQSFFKIPKIIRININYLILLKLSGDRDLRLIVSEYGLGITPDELMKIYKHATSKQFDALKIDCDESNNNRKFSRNWKSYYHVDDDDSDKEVENDILEKKR